MFLLIIVQSEIPLQSVCYIYPIMLQYFLWILVVFMWVYDLCTNRWHKSDLQCTLSDERGGPCIPSTSSHLGPISSIFKQFSANILPNNRLLHLYLGTEHPLLEFLGLLTMVFPWHPGQSFMKPCILGDILKICIFGKIFIFHRGQNILEHLFD